MRIISGNFKGKKIFHPLDNYTRPLRDMVKESIFNLIKNYNKINFKIYDSNVLDLFSGSGSFGLECISREAKKVMFVENYKKALITLKKNISLLNANKITEVVEKDCFDFLEKDNLLKSKFNIIFMDPPYREKKINILLNKIKEKEILEKNGIIILHRHKKDDSQITTNFKILDERNYGISKIIIGN